MSEARTSAIERFFGIGTAGSNVRTEVFAGITTFLTAMYIIVVNPAVLAQGGVPFSAALTATVLVSFLGSCAMGLYARNPVLVAPGMGMNALFAFVMVHGGGMPWQTALGCVFWSGVIFALLALLNVRKLVVDAIPENLRHAVSCGIGLFISLIGLVNAKFIVGDPVTLVHSAKLNPVLLTFLAGLALTIFLVARRTKGALMIGIVLTTLLAMPIGRWWGDGSAYGTTTTLVNWQGFFAMPDFSGIGQLDLLGCSLLSSMRCPPLWRCRTWESWWTSEAIRATFVNR
jgi:AGZA family xanthine/uracil permease-like MFS transporter